mmetsp:Transcript_48243/g.35429  ORF Transcript_48243/g.35429 Transcript_48243/m.35429 type:complete len:112 (+) Transcript_48243:1035-1370(+)
MGGAMDLVSSVRKVIVVMALSDKYGEMKFKKEIDLPFTGQKCVSMLITDHGVFYFRDGKVVLTEVSKDSSLETIRSLTDVEYEVADKVQLMEDNSSKYGTAAEDDIFDGLN